MDKAFPGFQTAGRMDLAEHRVSLVSGLAFALLHASYLQSISRHWPVQGFGSSRSDAIRASSSSSFTISSGWDHAVEQQE